MIRILLVTGALFLSSIIISLTNYKLVSTIWAFNVMAAFNCKRTTSTRKSSRVRYAENGSAAWTFYQVLTSSYFHAVSLR